MNDNLSRVMTRLADYRPLTDDRFRGDSGLRRAEEDIAQKLRQYWADESIPNEEKLRDFEMDLSDLIRVILRFLNCRASPAGLKRWG